MATALNKNYTAQSGEVLYAGRVSTVPAYVTNSVSRHWFRMGNGLDIIDPRWLPDVNPLYDPLGLVRPPWGMGNWNIEGIFAYSGGCYDPVGEQLLQWGGGHGDYGGNGIYALGMRLAEPTWRAERHPAGSIGNWDGVDLIGFDPGPEDIYVFNGEPRSAHSYNGVCVADGRMYITQGYKYNGNNGSTLFGYNLTSREWDVAVAMPSGGVITRDMCHDTLRNQLVCIGQGNASISFFDIDTQTFSSTSTYTNTSSGARMIYIPTIDAVVGLNHMVGSGFFAHDFGRTPPESGSEIRPSTTGTSPFIDSTYDLKCGVWVPSLGKIVGWSYGANLWTLEPPGSGDITDTWTWGTLLAAPENTVVPTGNPGAQDPSVFGRLFLATIAGVDLIGLSTLEPSGNEAIQPYFFRI